MKKSGWMIALLMFGCLLTVGCHKEESYDMQIYYLNSEETALNTEGYNLKSDKAEGQVQEVLKKMQNPKDSVECVPAIPTDLRICISVRIITFWMRHRRHFCRLRWYRL